MTPLERQIDEFRESLQRPDVPVVLAVSGGADSTALACAWRATQTPHRGPALLAHFNHGWRGDESDEDARFVQRLGAQLGLIVEVGAATTSADSSTGGSGLEAVARRERYAFLAEVAARHGARYLATAHTADDQAETVLHRLLRGTGALGLAGIPRFRAHSEALTIVRPLLDVRRAALRAYLDELGQDFREDSSNRDERRTRNRIRQHLLPLLETEYSSDIVERLQHLAERLRDAHDTLAYEVEGLLARAVERDAPGVVRVLTAPLRGVSAHLVREFFVRLWTLQHWPARDMNRFRWRELVDLALSPRPRGAFVAPRMFPGGIRVSAVDDWLQFVQVES